MRLNKNQMAYNIRDMYILTGTVANQSGTWTVPPNVDAIEVEMCGGGGGGGGNSAYGSGGSGGSGAYFKGIISVTPNEVLSIQAGKYGVGANPGGGGTAGGLTSITGIVSCGGGNGGSAPYVGQAGPAGTGGFPTIINSSRIRGSYMAYPGGTGFTGCYDYDYAFGRSAGDTNMTPGWTPCGPWTGPPGHGFGGAGAMLYRDSNTYVGFTGGPGVIIIRY